MKLLKLDPAGTVERYPYQFGDLLADHPSTSFPVPLTPADLAGLNVAVLAEVPPPAITPDQQVFEDTPALVDGVWTQQWSVEPLNPSQALTDRKAMAAHIDAACAAITGRFLPFMREYEAREAQAQAYKDAGYTGTVPVRVAEFATPAGMAPAAAADLILSQANALRASEAALSGLRMRKYEVMGAASQAAAVAAHAQIMTAIAAVGAAI